MNNRSLLSSKLNQIGLDKLKVFYAIAQTGNFEKAGELIGIKQSSISKNIILLEQELGTVLINRKKGSQGNILTAAGETFFKATLDIFHRLEEGIAEIENKESISGHITIATTKGFGISLLLPKLFYFKKTHPDIVFEVILVDVFQNLVNHVADIYISPKYGDASTLIHDHIGNFEFRAYASKEYIEQFGKPNTADDLDNHRIVSFRYRSFLPQTNWLLTAGVQKGMEREPCLDVDDVNAQLLAVENGEGISVFVQYIEKYSPNLVRILEKHYMGNLELYLIRNIESQQSKKINLLATYLTSLNG